MMKNTTKFYKTYQSALEGAGHKDAVKQSHGIYGGSLMYVFDDERVLVSDGVNVWIDTWVYFGDKEAGLENESSNGEGAFLGTAARTA